MSRAMEQSKHTPGPWTAEDGYVFDKQKMVAVAEICNRSGEEGHKPKWEEADANARLIAAAPDLLAALRAMLSMHAMPTEQGMAYRDNIGAMNQARAAIARATQPA